MKVIVKAKSGDAFIGEDYTKVDGDALRMFNGVDCQDCFTEYMDEEIEGLTGGYMSFKFEDGILNVYTEYESTRELTKEECEQLADYTQGQWSDGIGEGFEQNACMYTNEDEECFLSPWYHGQVVEVIQIK